MATPPGEALPPVGAVRSTIFGIVLPALAVLAGGGRRAALRAFDQSRVLRPGGPSGTVLGSLCGSSLAGGRTDEGTGMSGRSNREQPGHFGRSLRLYRPSRNRIPHSPEVLRDWLKPAASKNLSFAG